DVGDAVLLGDEGRELLLLEEAELGDLRAQPRAAGLRFVTRLPQLLGRDQVLSNQEFADPLVQIPVSASGYAGNGRGGAPLDALLRPREKSHEPARLSAGR